MTVDKEHGATGAVTTHSRIVLHVKENTASIQKDAILVTKGNHSTMHGIC